MREHYSNEQLRYPSERAGQLAALGQSHQWSWTSEGPDAWLRKGHCSDLTSDLLPEEERREAQDRTQDELGVVSAAASDNEARQVRRRMTL